MQPINCKISYKNSQNIIYTTELKNSDYKIDIKLNENNLTADIQTATALFDFKVQLFLKIDKKYTTFVTNGYQTWSPSNKIEEDTKNSNFYYKMIKKLSTGSGFDYVGEYDSTYNPAASYGLCHLSQANSNHILLFASLGEKDTFTKYSYDFKRQVLKITRHFKGYSVNKNMQIANIICIEDSYNQAFEKLKNHLSPTPSNQKRLVGYNTFVEFGSNINEATIKSKVHSLQNCYNFFVVGDGYSGKGYDIFDLDSKRFPNGLKQIVDDIHKKGIMAGIWIAPFAISPLSNNYAQNKNLVLKQEEKAVVCCPFWGGANSLDVTNEKSYEYLKGIFDLICNDWGFDIIYCDCMYMAGAIPTNGMTQAMMIAKGIEIIKKLTKGKTLIFGGVPFLSAVGSCDYISISQDNCSFWSNPFDFISPELPISAKSNLQSLAVKKYQNMICPCIYSIPDNDKIKIKLLNCISTTTDSIIVPESMITPKTYPTQIKICK